MPVTFQSGFLAAFLWILSSPSSVDLHILCGVLRIGRFLAACWRLIGFFLLRGTLVLRAGLRLRSAEVMNGLTGRGNRFFPGRGLLRGLF